MSHDAEACAWCSRPPQWARPRDVAILLGRPLKTIRAWMAECQTRAANVTEVNYWEIRCRDERSHQRPNRKGRRVA